jgi:endonuclease YncB( thermonuclease family)
MKLFLISLFLLTQTNCRYQSKTEYKTLTGKAVKIVDGDTFDLLLDDLTTVRVRLHAIDCPEKRQDYGRVAKDALSAYIFSKPVKVLEAGKDRYGRVLGEVYAGGIYVNLQLVEDGLAWRYVQYSDSKVLAAAEERARLAKKGLWALEGAEPPWEFRVKKKKAP